MKRQAFNPYLPSYEYIPDGEPHVFGSRVYVFGSHDRFNGKKFCMNDYVCWSAPVDDLTDWKYEGIIYKKTQHPGNEDGKRVMYAPDVAKGPDGRYYLYYGLADDMALAVAVCDEPAGAYEFYGFVHDKNGVKWGEGPDDFMPFDPGILADDDGRIHLYAGQGPLFKKEIEKDLKKHFRNTAYHAELEEDMLTMKSAPEELIPSIRNSEGTGFEGHEFFEANSIRKFNGKYYFIYSSVLMHELAYAISDRPDGGFTYGGTLTSSADIGLHGPVKTSFNGKPNRGIKYYIGNNHGSVEKINGRYYVFGHRQTNRSSYSRQGYADPIEMTEDGRLLQAERTSCGLNGGPLRGCGVYEARIAYLLQSRDGACHSMKRTQNRMHPYITQEGEDRENDPNQYIANMRSGAVAGFRYFALGSAREIGIRTRGFGTGKMIVTDAENNGNILAVIEVRSSKRWKQHWSALKDEKGVKPLYFTFEGKGHIDFMNFCLR